jgi:hypothetical protein
MKDEREKYSSSKEGNEGRKRSSNHEEIAKRKAEYEEDETGG